MRLELVQDTPTVTFQLEDKVKLHLLLLLLLLSAVTISYDQVLKLTQPLDRDQGDLSSVVMQVRRCY